MYSLSDFKNIIDAAENLVQAVENHLMQQPNTLTAMTIAASEFRMAQIEADANLKQMLNEMAEQDYSLQNKETFDTIETDTIANIVVPDKRTLN